MEEKNGFKVVNSEEFINMDLNKELIARSKWMPTEEDFQYYHDHFYLSYEVTHKDDRETHFDLSTKNYGDIRCPFCPNWIADKHTTLTYIADKQCYYCKQCKTAGDVISLFSKYKEWSPRKTVLYCEFLLVK